MLQINSKGVIKKFKTPLFYLNNNIYMKMENFNPGGSHKTRSAQFMIKSAIENDLLNQDVTVIEKTGGNLGIGLAIETYSKNIKLELAVGLSFSKIKRSILQLYGAKLIGMDMLNNGAQPMEVIEYQLDNADKNGKQYFFIDQFNNDSNYQAHYKETGPELISQLKKIPNVEEKNIVLVGGIGSGASICGIGDSLRNTFNSVEIIGVQPNGCDILNEVFVDHDLQGIAVGIKPNIFKPKSIDRYISVSEKDAIKAQIWLAKNYGIFAGNTTGANYCAVKNLIREEKYSSSNVIIITICYDSGEAYINV